MRYVRIENELVVEVVDEFGGFTIDEMFHPDLVAEMVKADEPVSEGWRWDGSKFSPPATAPLIALEAIKLDLKNSVDAMAEAERLKYITPGEGQAMTYRQKVDEAQAFKATKSPLSKDYPVLSSEIGITASSLDAVADIVLAAYAQWQQIGAAIERARLGAKRDIEAAKSETEARGIVNAIVWPPAH